MTLSATNEPVTCGKPWRGMADDRPMSEWPKCPRRPGHRGLCGPLARHVWIEDVDAYDDFLLTLAHATLRGG